MTVPRQDYYVYGLADSTNGRVFYVGKGCGNRAASHERAVVAGRHCNPLVAEQILSIRDRGAHVVIVRIAEGLTEAAAFARERLEIGRRDELCNLTVGTASGYEWMRARAKAQIRRFTPFREWVTERARTPAQVARYWSLLKAVAREVANPTPNELEFNPDGSLRAVKWSPDR